MLLAIGLVLLGACVPRPQTNIPPPIPEPDTGPNPMVHTDGVRIVDGDGTPIRLRGVLLEGWLHWNGPLWGAGLTSEKTIEKRLVALVGPEETERFRQRVYESFMSERDIARIAQLGFNVVRVPFNHRILEDDARPYVYKDSGWRHLDHVIDWCEQQGIYAVLDLHSVPGGQSGLFVNDPDKVKLWDSEENMRRTVALWAAIASRYHDRTHVAGYDLMNEPDAPRDEDLADAYLRIIDAIRAVDPHHMIILEGGGFAASDFSMFDRRLCPNQVYSFHTYNFFGDGVDRPHLQRLARMARQMNVPLWNGEFGAHTDRWTAEVVELFEEPDSLVNGWIFWPWKRVSESDSRRFRYRHLMEIESTPRWDRVRGYCSSLFGLGRKPSRAETLGGMQEFLEASRAENLILDPPMLEALLGRTQAPQLPGKGSAH